MQVANKIYLYALFAILASYSTFGYAQAINGKGMATIEYTSLFGPSAQDKSNAVDKAKLNALERHVANVSQSRLQAYEKSRSEIERNIDDYVMEYSVLSEDTDKKSKRYQVVIKTSINATRLDTFLDSQSAIANVSSDDASYMMFMVVARSRSSVKSYDAKVYKRTDTNQSIGGAEYEVSSGANVEYEASESTSESVTTGGSTTQKSDVVEWDVFSSEGINSAMTEVFATVGFEMIEAEYLEEESGGLISVNDFKSDYQSGDDLSGETKRNAAKGLISLEIPYMTIGTLDVGMKDTDPTSGLTRVYVSVNAQVLDVSNRFPKKVASVGPVQHAGLGPSEQVARNNALKLAASEAARELANQMNAKGIH